MVVRVLFAVLLGLCWRTSRVEGVTFSLRGDSISTSGNEVINVTDIGNDNDNALVCQSERSPSSELTIYPHWYVDTDGDFPNTGGGSGNTRLLPENYDTLGWNRDRLVNNENPRIAYLRRQSGTALEGYFTCYIPNDDNNPRGLYILYPLSVTVSVRVASRSLKTYRVTCTATGGRLSSGSLTGPGLPSSGLSLPDDGSSDRGENTYSRTSDTLSEDVGSVYTCTATNDVSSPETSLELAAAGDPTLEELVPLSPTAVRVTWSRPSSGATVTGYSIHYTRDGGSSNRISGLPPSTTGTDITGLSNGRTYTITVEAIENGLSGESEERTITLRIDPPAGVMVDDVEPASVRVSWQAVENADSYTVTFTQATGADQQGLCPDESHTASVSVDTTSVSIDVGQDVGDDVTDMLRAYTTYFITVVAVSDVLGTSDSSEPAEHTTIQKGAAEAPTNVRAINHSSTTITVQWSGLSTCRLVNGLIVKYRVQYTANGRVQSTDQPVDCRNRAETTLTGLEPSTTYSIQVAAVNEEGDVGMYSEPITEQTEEDTLLGMNLNTECDSSTVPIIIGVVIGIIGVAVGVSGLIIAVVTVKKYRPVSSGGKAGGVYVSTDANPAYGLSSPHQKHTESQSDYETPQYIQPSSAAAPQETVYEGVF